MRQLLLIFTLLCASYMTVNAQTNTWNGSADNNWSNTANWSLNAVPTAANDVVIPTGKTVNLNVVGTTKSIVVQGNSTFNISNTINFLNASSFAANTTINVGGASINGGTLNNSGMLNFIGGTKYIGGTTILNNAGTMTFVSGAGDFYMYDTATINNQASGVIDIQSDSYAFYPGDGNASTLNNLGMLKKTGGNATAYISSNMTNSGTISVSSGTLVFDIREKTFNGGVYNVTSGNTMTWNTTVNVSGTLTGAVAGNLLWNNVVRVASAATFNFTGANALSLVNAQLNGDGTLTNSGTLNFVGGTKYMGGTTILNNTGTMNYKVGSGDFYLYNSCRINNQSTGVIDIKADVYAFYPGDGDTASLNNVGLIKKTGGDNIAYISTNMINSGTISVTSGTLQLDIREKILNGGIYTATAGNNMYWNSIMNVSGTLTGTVEGNIFWNNVVRVATTATFNFSGSNALSLLNAQLNGDGTLTNTGNLNFVGGTKYMGGTTVLNNSGTITQRSGAGDFYMYDTARVNNQVGGIIDLKADNYAFYPGDGGISILNNAGLIKKTAGTATAYLSIEMINTGTINVSMGTVNLDIRQKTLNGGVYIVSSGSALLWNTTINASNTLTGAVNGTLTWNNVVSVASTANFNFTGSSGLTMASASLNGDGALTNSGTFNFVGGTKAMGGNTVFNNEGTMTSQSGAGDFYMYDTTVFNNKETGVFDIKSDNYVFYSGNGGGQMVINMGLFKKTGGANIAYITEPFTNSGTIEASSGNLLFTNGYNLTNTVDGIIKGTATLTLPSAANFVNNGTFAPGGSPGTLSVLGDFKSTATSVLDVELLGLAPITGYDVLAITGNAIFNGIVNVTLGFAPILNNEFVIATTTGTITQCNLASSTSAEFNGMQYTFSVLCRNNNQVVLKVTNVTLGIDDSEISEASVLIFPNPTNNYVTLKNKSNLDLTSATLVDISGRILKMIDLKGINTDVQISLEGYAIGTYFLKINGLNSSVTKRVIKQ